MSSRRWLLQAIAALCLLVSDPALAAWNLLQNGTFDTTAAPWTTVGAAGFDASRGNPNGSLHLLVGLGLTCSSAASECINASVPGAFDLAADNLALGANPGYAVNQLRLATFLGTNCASPGPILDGPGTGSAPPLNVWQPLDGIVFLPAGTASVQLTALLCVTGGGPSSNGSVNFDNVALRPAFYVYNPHFNLQFGIKPWIGPGLVLDATRDSGGDASSGSAQVTSTSSASCSTASQCVLTRSGPLDLDAKILLPSSNTAPGQAEVQFVFTADRNCDPATTLGTATLGPASGPPDTWNALSSSNASAPAGTQAVLVELTSCASAAGTFAANFDDVLADPLSVAEIPTLNRGGLAALGVLLLAGALLALRRAST
ncbi:MAG: hypothetical protein ACM3OB_08990 [Acidobacteriota bacterium]